MKCNICDIKISKERWEVTHHTKKKIYCGLCFAKEWGDYLNGIVLLEGYVKKDKKQKQIKLKHQDLDLKFKKYFISMDNKMLHL